MPALAAVIVPAPLLEDDDLVAARLLDELGRDFGAGDEGRADLDIGAGPDPLKAPIGSVRPWDMKDGEAEESGKDDDERDRHLEE